MCHCMYLKVRGRLCVASSLPPLPCDLQGLNSVPGTSKMHPYPLTHPTQSIQRLHYPLCRKESTSRTIFLVSSLTQADNMITGELYYSHKKGNNTEVYLSEHVTWEVRSCWCCWGAVPSLITGFNRPNKEWVGVLLMSCCVIVLLHATTCYSHNTERSRCYYFHCTNPVTGALITWVLHKQGHEEIKLTPALLERPLPPGKVA